jgi:hypothetical protein
MQLAQGHALLVGVGEYANPQLNAQVTTNAARALAQVLRDPQAGGYPTSQVIELTGSQATKADILGSLDLLARRAAASPRSIVTLFFSGHGENAPDGGYYFLSHEASRLPGGERDPQSVVTSAELTEAFNRIKSQRLLVIFDTCASGVMPGSLAPADHPGGEAPSDAALDRLMASGEGRVIISACRGKQLSYYPLQAQYTYFAEALLGALSGAPDFPQRQGYIGVFELYDYLFRKMQQTLESAGLKNKQQPVITIRQGVGPFPVALYRGQGNLSPDDSDLIAAFEKAPTASETVRVLPAIRAGRDVIQVHDNSGIINTGRMGNVNTGSGTQFNNRNQRARGDIVQGNTYNNQQSGGTRQGDFTFSGDFRGGIINASSTVNNSFGGTPDGADSKLVELEQLGQQLSRELAKLPENLQETRESMSESLDALLVEARKANPNTKKIKNRAEELNEALDELPRKYREIAELVEKLTHLVSA